MAEQPLGHQVWEGWADALLLPPGPAHDAAFYLYDSDLITGVRIMGKFWEYDHDRERYLRLTVEKARVAHRLGLKVQLSICMYRTASGPDDYHKKRYLPDDIKPIVKQMILDCELYGDDEVEVGNEPYYSKPGIPKMTMGWYLNIFNQFAAGARRANWNGRIVATQDHPDRPGNFRNESWIWHGEWGKCAESKHSFVLDQRSTNPDVFYDEILASLDNPRRYAVGWKWPVWENEHSSVGRQVHINSALGADMCEASWKAYKFKRCPWCWLIMGGDNKWFGAPPGGGGWNMNTCLIANGEQEGSIFSKGAQRLMQLAGVDVPDDPGNGDPPDPPGGGIQKIRQARRRVIAAETHWGTPKGLRKAELAIRSLEAAIGRS